MADDTPANDPSVGSSPRGPAAATSAPAEATPPTAVPVPEHVQGQGQGDTIEVDVRLCCATSYRGRGPNTK